MGDGQYTCYGDDKEDLTEKVLAAKSAEETRLLEAFEARTKRRRWRVVVTCSKGHQNAFEGED